MKDPFGRVGVAPQTASGTLNTVRWYYGWTAGTVFTGGSTTVNVSAVRPGDGAIAAQPYTFPIHYVTAVTKCVAGDTTPQPVFGTP